MKLLDVLLSSVFEIRIQSLIFILQTEIIARVFVCILISTHPLIIDIVRDHMIIMIIGETRLIF